ncbi:MAG: hypothetical protein JWN63_525, partial [Candidatus Acidoferrum typicum]|nr:hypothetical protein [Candidatus Acidoferrum typicum]
MAVHRQGHLMPKESLAHEINMLPQDVDLLS